jgi:predicted unusual protein kinase regulating ubiquinone biosynthesis (AarF/ABC1/UbiB family)
MNPQPAHQINKVASISFRSWPKSRQGAAADAGGGVLRAMPRQRFTRGVETIDVVLPMAQRVKFKPGFFLPCMRLMVWLWTALRFGFAVAVDSLSGRGSVQQRAVRFREAIEQAGASFIKVGQQLSVRADVLPYAYCAELTKLLDRVAPIATSQAIAVIERSLGKPLAAIFETFDPAPIGSASLACVYQAVLKSGEHVAVKVRRPGIDRLIAADLRALGWLLIAAETCTLMRPGMTAELRRELRKILMRELNFRAEARYNEIFRLQSHKDDEGITAPLVFFDYCSEEVLVNEFVSGVWMWELVSAVDRNDREALADMRRIGIEPGIVARRMVRALHRQLLDHLFFHADPHPANIVVMADSRICFVDFGAIGRFSSETRNTWRELQVHMRNQDIERMVRCSFSLAGSLPPLNVDDAFAAMEEIYADWVYAIASTDAQWWERSSAQNWIRYMGAAREYGIPISLETIQFFRATFLYDTIIARLDKTVDPVEEWETYAQQAGREARNRMRRFVRKRLYGPTGKDYLRIEQLADVASQFVFRFQKTVEQPVLEFQTMASKVSYAVSLILRFVLMAGILICIVSIAQLLVGRTVGTPFGWVGTLLLTITHSGWFDIAVLGALLVVLRKILIRTSQPEPPRGRRDGW